jgi:type VI secretion system protein ImpM
MLFQPSHTGFFGKLPARGDFVRAGLPEDFVAPLDLWCRECLVASRAALGDGWEDAWMVAPIWHFWLPPGACGPRAVLGIWMPGMDRARRLYPFMLCALAESLHDLAGGAAWASAAAQAGLACLVEDAPLEPLGPALAAPVAAAPLHAPGWWTEGSEHVRPRRYDISGLLPPTEAGTMLRDASPAEL